MTVPGSVASNCHLLAGTVVECERGWALRSGGTVGRIAESTWDALLMGTVREMCAEGNESCATAHVVSSRMAMQAERPDLITTSDESIGFWSVHVSTLLSWSAIFLARSEEHTS